MRFHHIVSKGQKLKVRKLQALSLSGKKVIKKNPTGEGSGGKFTPTMHNRVKLPSLKISVMKMRDAKLQL